MGWVLLALGIAAYGADYLIGANEATNQRKREQENLKNVADKKKEDLEQDKVDLEKTYTDSVARENEKFNIAKAEANEQAKRADLQTTQQEGYISADYNNYLQQMGIGMQQTNQAINAGMMQNGQNAGSSLANTATAGIRGNSSVMGAVGRQAAYQDKQLAQNITAQNEANNLQLQSAIRSMNQSRDAISDARYNANYLRKSYLEGGSQYKLQQNNLNALQSQYNQQLTNINRQIANLSGDESSTYYDAITGQNVTLTNTDYRLSLDNLSDKYYSSEFHWNSLASWYGLGSSIVKGFSSGYKAGSAFEGKPLFSFGE